MARIFAFLTVGVLLLGLPQAGSAQVSNLALGQAKARLACGAGVVVSAVMLPNGSIQVTCARNPVESATSASTAASVAGETGLVASAGIGAVISLGIVAIFYGGGGAETNTSSLNRGGGGGPER